MLSREIGENACARKNDRFSSTVCSESSVSDADARYDAKLNPEGENGRFLLNASKEGRIAVTRARGPERPSRAETACARIR